MKIPNTVPINIPPIAPVPIDLFPLAPAPVAIISGTRPKINAKEVIKIGLNLAYAPFTAASTRFIPWRRLSTAYSTIKIAFLASRPISIIKVI